MPVNVSSVGLLMLQPLGLSNAFMYPAFVFSILTYLFVMFCNLLLLIVIAGNRKLHRPMFILLFNLPISDMVGATAFYPQLLLSIVTQSRLISHPACFTQAFLVHVYGTGNLLILSAMAYDRYIAICCPLRYNTIMTPQTLIQILVSIWFINISIVVTLFAPFACLRICRTNIVDLFCNNPSLLKVVCGDTRVNNYYGMFTIVIFQGAPLALILYTYAQILRTCLGTNKMDARQKAIQTCASHLTVYLLLEINTLITLISHRAENASPFLRKVLGVSILVFPPLLDPIIYGLNTQELKQSIKMFLKRKTVSSER